jgi:hypothetical protein
MEADPTQQHLELDLNLIEREFHDTKVPYNKRSREVQDKINRVLNFKAQDITKYAQMRNLCKIEGKNAD